MTNTATPAGRSEGAELATPAATKEAHSNRAGVVSRRRSWTLLAASLGFAAVQLDISVVNVAIKPIGAELGGQVGGLQWVVNAYTVAFASLMLSAGALGDRLGSKRIFIAGFGLFTVASAACGLAPSLGVLNAARAIQGVGAAMLLPCSLAVINHAYPERPARARAVALWAAGASVAFSAGPLVGGVLTASLGWRSIFFINLPIGVAGIALALRYASETPRSHDRSIDLPGQVLAVVSLVGLAWSTITAGEHGFTTVVIAGYALAALTGAIFVQVEAKRATPMLPLGLFSSRTFSAAALVGVLVNVAFYGLIFVLSLYFQETRGYSALVAGAAFAPPTAGVLAANLVTGRVQQRIGPRRTILVGAIAMAASLAGLLIVNDASGYGQLAAQLIVLGFGLGLLFPAMVGELMSSVDLSHSGVASGTLNSAGQIGSVIGVALFGALAATELVVGLRLDLIIAIVATVAAAALTAVMDRDPAPRPELVDKSSPAVAGAFRT